MAMTPRGEARRLKTKMKKCDPEAFTIHDFLAECKNSDAADSRFEEAADQRKNETNFFVVGVPPIKLGNLYSSISQILGEQPGWKQKKDDSGRFHLIFGGANGNGIPFKRFAQLFKWDYGITPHCNYFRGHVWLTQKVKLVQTLRSSGLDHIIPESYLFFPSCMEDNETENFRIASESGCKRAVGNTWIAKATDASSGERTLISDDLDTIMNLIENQDKASPAWCVSKYISNPLLLPGGRKFDLRYFVLVNSQIEGFVASEAVLKSCSAEFTMDDLTDKMAHLSNAKIQASSKESGMPIEQFAKWLSSEHGANYEASIEEPAHDMISRILQAAKPKLENMEHADYTSFQVFAFDFLIDSDLKLWFLEASAPKNVAPELVDDMAVDVIDLAIRPVFGKKSSSEGKIFRPLFSRGTATNNKK